MPASARQIVPEDLLPDTEFAKVRGTRRAALLATKRLRRIALGPYCTFYFESFETMLFQVQEMLLIEKGGAAQMADELAAYNPLIPQGSELVATMMFELDDPIRRARLLAGLGGVEDRLYIEVAGERIFAEPESDVERTRDDGKTSSVHFLRFRFTPALVEAFQNEETQARLGCDDPRYSHIAILAPESRRELATDFD